MSADLFYRVSILADTTEYDLSEEVSSFTIEEASGKPDALKLNVNDPHKVLSHALQEGMTVEVDLGTVDEFSLIFRGRIYKVESGFQKAEVPTLRVLAHDRSMAMGLRKRNRPWSDITLSQLVIKIARDYFDPQRIEIELMENGNPKFTGNGIRQREQTDLDFLNKLAKCFGCEMFVVAEDEGDVLYFKAQYLIMTEAPEVSLYHGRDCGSGVLLDFQANSSVKNMQIPRILTGIDPDTGDAVEMITTTVEDIGAIYDEFMEENMSVYRAEYPERATQLDAVISNAPNVQEDLRKELGYERQAIETFTTEKELNILKANQYSTSVYGMRAKGSTYGNQYMHAQQNTYLADVGGHFSGIWYLSEVRHLLDDQGYRTEFQCIR
jgi:phage protein D